MSTSQPVIKASPSQVDLLAGPLIFALVLGAASAFGIGSLFWKADELIDHWEVLLIFGLIFLVLLAVLRSINASISFWKIEDGAVYKGKKLLFYLNEIEAAQIGLPDNWADVIARLPIKFRGSGGIAYHAMARKQVIVLKLKQRRWFMWSGLQYQNFEQFRDALLQAAPDKSIRDMPDSVAAKMRLVNVNRILCE